MASISQLLNRAAYLLEDYANAPTDNSVKWDFFYSVRGVFGNAGAQAASLHLIKESGKIDPALALVLLGRLLSEQPQAQDAIFAVADRLITLSPMTPMHPLFERYSDWNPMIDYVMGKHADFLNMHVNADNIDLFMTFARYVSHAPTPEIKAKWAGHVAKLYHDILSNPAFASHHDKVLGRLGGNPDVDAAVITRYPSFVEQVYRPAVERYVLSDNNTSYIQIRAFKNLLHNSYATSPFNDVLVETYQHIFENYDDDDRSKTRISHELSPWHYITALHEAVFADYESLVRDKWTTLETNFPSETYPLQLAHLALALQSENHAARSAPLSDETVTKLIDAMAVTHELTNDVKKAACLRFEIFQAVRERTNDIQKQRLCVGIFGDVLNAPMEKVLAFQYELGGYAAQIDVPLAHVLLHRSTDARRRLDVLIHIPTILDTLDKAGIGYVADNLAQLARSDADVAFGYFTDLSTGQQADLVYGVTQAFIPLLNKLSPRVANEAAIYMSKNDVVCISAPEAVHAFSTAQSQPINRKHRAFSVKVKAP